MQVQEWNQEWLQTLTYETPSSLRPLRSSLNFLESVVNRDRRKPGAVFHMCLSIIFNQVEIDSTFCSADPQRNHTCGRICSKDRHQEKLLND